jgi:pyridinium-3,5-bisthiocarboxylic acid mononucleotide nickel chelatase
MKHMKTLYLDIFSGISGDMFLGALLDLGVDARRLERELKKLKLDGYHLHITRQLKSGIEGVKLDVHLADAHEHHHEPKPHHVSRFTHHGHQHHHNENRTFAEIKKLIGKSKLSAWVKKKSAAVFQRIAEAEGKIHGLPPEKVHFHEVGAVDSIVDTVGACVALELLGRPRVLVGPVIEGTGWVDCAHGRFPVPAPATLAILGARGIGVTQCDEPHELVTPTGAALLAEFVESFGPMQDLTAEKIGFGLGTRENRTRPNVLRAVLGKHSTLNPHPSTGLDWETDRIAVLETNLDDLNPEILGNFIETAMAAGALDVFYTPVQMKKTRPGVLLTVLCAETDADRFSELILRETSAFGVRRTLVERRKLRREFTRVKTPFGEVVIKVGRLNGKVVQATPEFESCKKLAARAKIPLKRIYEAALKAVHSGR